MKSPIVGLRVAGILFGMVAVAHIIRLMACCFTINIIVAGHPLPLWVSGVGAVVTGALSLWMWQLSLIKEK